MFGHAAANERKQKDAGRTSQLTPFHELTNNALSIERDSPSKPVPNRRQTNDGFLCGKAKTGNFWGLKYTNRLNAHFSVYQVGPL